MSEHLHFRKDEKIPAVDLHEFGVDNLIRHEACHYFAVEKQGGMTRKRLRIME